MSYLILSEQCFWGFKVDENTKDVFCENNQAGLRLPVDLLNS